MDEEEPLDKKYFGSVAALLPTTGDEVTNVMHNNNCLAVANDTPQHLTYQRTVRQSNIPVCCLSQHDVVIGTLSHATTQTTNTLLLL